MRAENRSLLNLYKRVVPVEETYRRLRDLMPRVGVTHVFDLTSLDSLGLPVCMAFGPLPKEMDLQSIARQTLGLDVNGSQADEKLEKVWASLETYPAEVDGISPEELTPLMSAGKGLAPLDARVSAMMEAVERKSARQVPSPTRRASYRQISQAEAAVDPRDLLLISPASYTPDLELEWVQGRDLKDNQPIWVPVEAATFIGNFRAEGRTFVDTPTGMGAGNVIEEAICHGVAEAIEHDAWALSVARQSLMNAEHSLFRRMFEAGVVSSQASSDLAFRPLDPGALSRLDELDGWLEKLERSQGWVRVYEITSSIGVPVISAALSGIPAASGDGAGRPGGRTPIAGPDGGGLGAHPDARVALARAVTESAQQRLILGLQARVRATRQAPPPPIATGGGEGWGERASLEAELQPFERIRSVTLPGIQDDIDYMLDALHSNGFERVVVVELTKPELGVPAVKVIVPGLADYWNNAAPPDWQAIQRRLQR